MANALQDVEKNETNGKNLRLYFEDGCLCIKDGKITKMAGTVSDWDAVAYYEKACTCSRNYAGNN